jgi:hypothetical protein
MGSAWRVCVCGIVKVAKSTMDSRRRKGDLSNPDSLKYEGDLSFYTQDEQIHRERLLLDPAIQKELHEWSTFSMPRLAGER